MKLLLPGACALGLIATSAEALEPLTFGEIKLTPRLDLYLYMVKDGGSSTDRFGYLDLTLTFTRDFGALSFGLEVFSEGVMDSTTEQLFSIYSDPYLDVGLWLQGERFGYLSFAYDASAIGAACIEAPYTSQNFGPADFVVVGTCPAFDTRSVLYYRTPDLGGGLKIAVSYMPETGFESVETGEAAESASVAFTLEHTDASGAAWTGSLGVERVLAVEGGGPEATAFQAGLTRERDGWTLGGALALTDNGDGTTDRGYGLGLKRAFSDKFSASLGVNHSQSRAEGALLDETSVALIGMYSFVPDKVILDGGLWQVEREDGGLRSSETVIGVGLSLYF